MKIRFALACLCVVVVPKTPASGILSNGHSSLSTLAAPSGNPYGVIVERNVFGLNPEPPPAPIELPKPDLPDIKLSGFVEVGASVRALFASLPKNPKEQPLYYNLAQGETDGVLQVVKLDLGQQEADIIISGTPMRLTMKEDGFNQTPTRIAAHNSLANPRQLPSSRPAVFPSRPSI